MKGFSIFCLLVALAASTASNANDLQDAAIGYLEKDEQRYADTYRKLLAQEPDLPGHERGGLLNI